MHVWLFGSAVLCCLLITVTAVSISNNQQYEDFDCIWNRGPDQGRNDPLCSNEAYLNGSHYPLCALFKYSNGKPVPCAGLQTSNRTDDNWCFFDTDQQRGQSSNTLRPNPGSWHIHVFFPNPACPNCSTEYLHERENFTYAGAMKYRAVISQKLNEMITYYGRDNAGQIDVVRAAQDPNYDQCIDEFNIVAGAPANYHSSPCIYEVDATKRLGPFTDPASGLGYPNYSFLLPGNLWMPGLYDTMRTWLHTIRRDPQFLQYQILLHPNTGCEVRDHVEKASIEWMGKSQPLMPSVFSCRALGCNQACPKQKLNRSHVRPPGHC